MNAADPRILPAFTQDERGRACLSLIAKIGASYDWRAALALSVKDIPAAMLPYALRSFAVQDYVEPGMKEIYVRRVIENALTIKVQEGTIKGVRYALGLIGMTISWTQWHKRAPMGAPGTHRIVVEINERLFDGEPLLSERSQKHALKVVQTVKRHSQDVEFSIAAAAQGAFCAAAVSPRPIQWTYFEGIAA